MIMAVAGRRAWVITPKADIDLGEIDAEARVQVVEDAEGRVVVNVA